MEPPGVRLYRIPLDAVPEDAFGVVPEAVRARCLRVVDPERGRRRLAAQAALRLVLAHETGVPPGRLRLLRGLHGKPRIEGAGVHFNLSDSDGLALVAVSPCAPLGVDLERIRPVPRWRGIARRVFGAAFEARLEALPPDQRNRALIAAWCRHEAWAKARGTGLAAAGPPPPGLDSAPPSPGIPLPPTPESSVGWWLTDVPAPEGFHAALVAAGAGARRVFLATEAHFLPRR